MYTPVLFTLLAATALAFPTPQSFLSGIPGLVMTPNQYTVPGCLGGQICPPWEWYRQLVNGGKPLTAESAETEKNDQSLAVRQETDEDEAGVFYCKDVGWGGDCIYRKTRLGSDPKDCTQINMEASTLHFFRRKLTPCSNAVCAPIASDGNDALTLTFPGNDNLGFTAKGDFNDRLLSYQCFRDENYALDPMEKSKAAAFEEAKAATIAEGKMM
ncbi:hypothetical protein N0V87_002325 [Didymella glomerata]|uniref:Uncharacterized protein n=1 Tax=Didymella glomerata TaxID=749621 RepID=A0A9W8X4D3_9PLEO|nr:hypothetical protein N0V87_002325 [Didymella glomerata]